MAEIIWSPGSIRDIEAIAGYIARNSLQYANAQVETFFERASILEKFPLIGRPVPELQSDSIRQILCGHYRIIYEILEQNRIGILTIHHQSRLLKNNPAFKKKLSKKKKDKGR